MLFVDYITRCKKKYYKKFFLMVGKVVIYRDVLGYYLPSNFKFQKENAFHFGGFPNFSIFYVLS